jgi:two-component system chemotaxis sensor kinase CheA
MGKLLYCDPPVEKLDDLEQLDGLKFALSSEQPCEEIRSHLRIVGVQRLQIEPLSEDVLRATREAIQQPQSASPTAAASSQQAPPKSSPAPAKKPTSAPAAAEAQNKGRAADSSGKPAETLRVDIDRLDHLMNLAGQLVINKARFSQIGEKMRPLIGNKQTAHLLTNAISSLEKMANEDDLGQGSSQADMDVVRSHARRILADLENVNRDVRRFAEARTSINELYEAIHQLDRVTDGIQKSVMDTRMVPVGPLFTRFKRVIRDITRNSGKEMRLVIRGEKTELDKRMIDELGDPLIHMVRNSADHGIESPEDREAAGKPRQGTVTLDAFHRGNSIVIQVTDDGRGLNLEKIRAKALEREIVSRADLDKMTPHQIYQLIWEPGFSTAEKVTEISGRGMGMDIVRSKIESINGAVELDSTPGEGSVFSIKLPLTLAILPSLMAEIQGDVFAIPVESVVEIVSVEKDAMSTVHGQQTATVRGRVVSVLHLHDLFTWSTPASGDGHSTDSEDTTLVIIGVDGQELGLVVHRLLGEEDIVIKSMAENYRNVLGVAGASILGDGRVSLILDIAALIEMSSKLETSVATV